ncbi:MAG TPA: trypsin-like peptidase domain-containing protein [Phycisphaerae bacterium]|nr:trypsin-like peptidase domain-containing protein [Phycisphaerae bacterium]
MNAQRVLALAAACWLAAPAGADRPPRATRETPVVRAYRKARPAVVNISAQTLVPAQMGMFGDAWDDIFGGSLSRRVPAESLGSGFVIHADGYVLTNAHVVRRAEKITVQMSDKTAYEARVLSADTKRDLAVLKLDLPAGVTLPALPLGRSDDLMVGETVIAVGNPFGLANTLTTGIVSALDRTLDFGRAGRYAGLIQTDAPINPGNSGGPVLNIHGEVIGLSTAIRADAQNIGFAIPIDAAAETLRDLLNFERIHRLVFGADVVQKHTDTGDELVVSAVRAGTPAHGKLLPGDRLVSLNGLVVRQIPDFFCAMLAVRGGEEVKLAVRRGGKELAVFVTVRQRPRPDGRALAQALLGLTLRPVTRELRQSLSLPVSQGLAVVALDAEGPAERIGLKPKDVVFQLDRLYVKDLDDLGSVLEDVAPGERLLIGIVRGNVRAWVEIPTRTAEQIKALEKKGNP